MPKSSKNDRLTQNRVLSPEQSRAARGWLGWSQAELAIQATVSLRTIASFERGEKMPMPNNLAAIRRVIVQAGVRLLFDDQGEAAGIARGDTEGEIVRSPRRSRQ